MTVGNIRNWMTVITHSFVCYRHFLTSVPSSIGSEVDVVSAEDGIDVLNGWHLTALQLGELQIIIYVDFKSA